MQIHQTCRVIDFDDEVVDKVVADNAVDFETEYGRDCIKINSGECLIENGHTGERQRHRPNQSALNRAASSLEVQFAFCAQSQSLSRLRIDHGNARAGIEDEVKWFGPVYPGFQKNQIAR